MCVIHPDCFGCVLVKSVVLCVAGEGDWIPHVKCRVGFGLAERDSTQIARIRTFVYPVECDVLSRDATHLQTRQKCPTNFVFSFLCCYCYLERTNERTETLTVFCYILPRKCLFCVCVCVQYDIIIIISQRAYKYNGNSVVCLFFFHEGGGTVYEFHFGVGHQSRQRFILKEKREGHG